MLIAGVLRVGAAVVMPVLGLRALVRPVGTGTAGVIMRSVAPPQLAGAIMLAAGGAVALAAPVATALPVICVCVAGALGTVAAGSYQPARYALRREEAEPTCGGSCAACTLACH